LSRRIKGTQSLRDSEAFSRVFSSKHRWADAHFLVIAVGNNGEPARLGLSVGKKYLRRATQRNRVKRIIRESFRAVRHTLHGLDLVVITKASPEKLPNALIATAMHGHWVGIANWLLKSLSR
jgi:ribonuclease P protein component